MPGEFLDLVSEDQVAPVVRGIEEAVMHSFQEDIARSLIVNPSASARGLTRDEMRRRTKICIEAMKEMRGDLKMSIPRIIDELPLMLRAKLDGTPWNPPERRSWIAPAKRH